jgi:hypothetical protein
MPSALQSGTLAMVAVGTTGEPALRPGIHLRRAFEAAAGFPPFGFALFRKRSKASQLTCLSIVLAGQQPTANAGYRTGNRLIQIHSDRPLRFVDQFPAGGDGQVEVDLSGRRAVTATFGGPLKRAIVTLVALMDTTVRAGGWWQGVLVDERVRKVAAAQRVQLVLRFDSIDEVRIDGAPALLVELCVEPLFPEGLHGWQRVPGFPYPLGLPLTHPDYPATGRLAEDPGRYRATALNRIVVPNLPPLSPAQLDTAYDDLLALIVAGPPQSQRSRQLAGQPLDGLDAQLRDNQPTLTVYTLQNVLRSALRPALA